MTNSNSLQMFSNSSFNVRIVMRDNKPWFVAKDVAGCIEYDLSSVNKMCSLCREKDVYVASARTFDSDAFSESGNSRITLVSESGLYRILAKCNLPKCELFESWVFDEVLPSIRQKGYYAIQERSSEQENTLPAVSKEDQLLLGVIHAESKEEKVLALKDYKVYRDEQHREIEQKLDEARKNTTRYQAGLASEMSGRVGGLQKANNSLRKENSELKDAVGRGCNWRTVSMMKAEWIKEFGHVPSWQKLKQFSKDVGIPPVQDVEEKVVLKDGSEKTTVSYRYHKEAWARYKKYEETLRVSPDEVSLV